MNQINSILALDGVSIVSVDFGELGREILRLAPPSRYAMLVSLLVQCVHESLTLPAAMHLSRGHYTMFEGSSIEQLTTVSGSEFTIAHDYRSL